MSDHVEHDGKTYYEESYLKAANQHTERAHANSPPFAPSSRLCLPV